MNTATMEKARISILQVALGRLSQLDRLKLDEEVEIKGVPGVASARLSNDPEGNPTLTHVNGAKIEPPCALDKTVVHLSEAGNEIRNLQRRKSRAEKRSRKLKQGKITWLQADPNEIHAEEIEGELTRLVDIAKFPYWMRCECGRRRYATANSIHEVQLCKICHREERNRRRRRGKK